MLSKEDLKTAKDALANSTMTVNVDEYMSKQLMIDWLLQYIVETSGKDEDTTLQKLSEWLETQ